MKQGNSRPKRLTRRNGEGEVYTRIPAVEEQIEKALLLDSPALLERARYSDYKSLGYLAEECLVYMIHEFRSKSDGQMVSDLFKVLLDRSTGFVKGHFQALEPERADDAFQEVFTSVVEQILDMDSDKGDFFQVRFWHALKCLAITEGGKQLSKQNVEEGFVSMDAEEEGEEGPKPKVEIPDGSMSLEGKAMYREGLGVLRDPYRKVFILRHYEGWPIYSKDPCETTLSSLFGVTPKTIYNWLKEAEETLRQWRGGERI